MNTREKLEAALLGVLRSECPPGLLPHLVPLLAEAAIGVLGEDRCTCQQAVHERCHGKELVDRCPWCVRLPEPRKPYTPTGMTEVEVKENLL